jgi:hypothetical protein
VADVEADIERTGDPPAGGEPLAGGQLLSAISTSIVRAIEVFAPE